MGVPGPWDDRLPHFRFKFTPSSGEELQSEYILPREHAPDALGALDLLRERIAPLLQISEIRTVAADGLWMSPSNGVACVCLHFTWKPEWEAVRALLPEIEAALAPFEARPHWGKLHTMSSETVRRLFPRIADFDALLRVHDPKGKFRNAFLDDLLGPI
ncbi:FAD-binding protein, partial [bacterium]